jgi:hypothetical protein
MELIELIPVVLVTADVKFETVNVEISVLNMLELEINVVLNRTFVDSDGTLLL